MDNSEPNTFDADLDAILNAGADPSLATPPKEGANPVSDQVWKAAGREWKDPSELAKAHDSITREYSKVKNRLKDAEEAERLVQYLNANPELLEVYQRELANYMSKRKGAASQSQNQEGKPSIPKEVADKLAYMEDFVESQKLNTEISKLKSKYQLNEADLREVLQFAHDNNGMALDQAYKNVFFDKKIHSTKSEAEKAGAEQAARSKRANVGPSSAHSMKPSEKDPLRRSSEERRKSLDAKLEAFGFRD